MSFTRVTTVPYRGNSGTRDVTIEHVWEIRKLESRERAVEIRGLAIEDQKHIARWKDIACYCLERRERTLLNLITQLCCNERKKIKMKLENKLEDGKLETKFTLEITFLLRLHLIGRPRGFASPFRLLRSVWIVLVKLDLVGIKMKTKIVDEEKVSDRFLRTWQNFQIDESIRPDPMLLNTIFRL